MADEQPQPVTTPATPERPKCGLVMPISAIDGCSDQHWLDVRAILTAAIETAGFQASLVSYADESGIIQKTIIQNLYQNPIVVCDVSGKNPNVMFELGIRLAFDRPTIVVKDDKTAYSFDTSPIEHVPYPRDLRYAQIVKFQESLATKVKATHEKATTDPTYTTFLKNFGEFTVAKLETTEVSKDDFIIAQLAELREAINSLANPYRSLQLPWGVKYTGIPAKYTGIPAALPNLAPLGYASREPPFPGELSSTSKSG